jgi:hypothetical protein
MHARLVLITTLYIIMGLSVLKHFGLLYGY